MGSAQWVGKIGTNALTMGIRRICLRWLGSIGVWKRFVVINLSSLVVLTISAMTGRMVDAEVGKATTSKGTPSMSVALSVSCCLLMRARSFQTFSVAVEM